MSALLRQAVVIAAASVGVLTTPCAQDAAHPSDLTAVFEREVERRLALPAPELAHYAGLLVRALEAAQVRIERTQFVLLIDRSAFVQAAMLWWLDAEGRAGLIGATPASTGRTARFEHFETPLGVFEQSLDNPDYRSEGTVNSLGIRGYGERGLRVYDFGWVIAPRGWTSGEQAMRLQLHATDPVFLEPHLGERASKGCIRIPASFNRFIDHHGVLDAAYDDALAEGRAFWVLRADRVPTPWSGRWMVVIDSMRTERPAWSPGPERAAMAATDKALSVRNATQRQPGQDAIGPCT